MENQTNLSETSENVDPTENIEKIEKIEKIDLSECISVLNFISTIEPNYKPCYKTKSVISKDAWWVTIRRRWNSEKGEEGILYVDKIMCSCDSQYHMCLENTEKNGKIGELYSSLKKSISGFSNLVSTYNDQKDVSDSYDNLKNKVLKLMADIKPAKPVKKKPILISVSTDTLRSKFFTTCNIKFLVS